MRNYQARNFMRDRMQVGDGVLFYHSSCPEPGMAGMAEVCSAAYPDATQFDRKSKYFDAKSTRETPRWMHVDVKLDEQDAPAGLARDARAARAGRHDVLRPATDCRSRRSSLTEWRAVLALLRA